MSGVARSVLTVAVATEDGREALVRTPMTTAGRPGVPAARRLDWRRLRGLGAAFALGASGVAGLGQALGTVVAGRLAEGPSARLVWLLAFCVVGAALLDTAGRTLWSVTVDRAEGRLRSDLLDSVMHQPVAALSEQAVGEVFDRVDDDTHEVGALLRQNAWEVIRVVLGSGPLLVVAGRTWWPAWLLLPLAVVGVLVVIRPLLGRLTERKVVEEMAWTDHAAAMEEGVAARDDLRTALGQAYVLRRCAELAAAVHARFGDVVVLESRISRRAGVLLHAVLAGTAVVGVALVLAGRRRPPPWSRCFSSRRCSSGRSTSSLGTSLTCRRGSARWCGCAACSGPTPSRSAATPCRPRCRSIEFRDLHFAYVEGGFALQAITLHVPAGSTWPWSVAPARASPPSPRCCPVPSSPSPARCCWAASTCSTSTSSGCAPRSAWSPSAPRSSRGRWPRTSRCSMTCPAAGCRARSTSSG